MLVQVLQSSGLLQTLMQFALSPMGNIVLTWLSVQIHAVQALSEVAVADENLVAYFAFDGNISDSSAYRHGSTLFGNAYFTDGYYGQALQLQGGYVEVQDSASLEMTSNDYSISVWIKNTVVAEYTPIVSKGGTDCSTGYALSLWGQGVRLANAYNGMCYAVCEAQYRVNDDEWHFIAGVVARASDVRLYVDGVLNATVLQATSRFSLANRENLQIGASSGPLAHRFRGAIDELRIYDYALRQEEISALYARAGNSGSASASMSLTPSVSPSASGENETRSHNDRNSPAFYAGLSVAGLFTGGVGFFAVKRCAREERGQLHHTDATGFALLP